MQGIRRKLLYLFLYEGIAIVLSTLLLRWMSGQGTGQAGPLAVAASLVAMTWNFVYNALFEAWEARYSGGGRGLWLRLGHACGFELGMMLMMLPLFALGLDLSLAEAFGLQVGMLVFFLLYSFGFTLGFDRVFGLPASAC